MTIHAVLQRRPVAKFAVVLMIILPGCTAEQQSGATTATKSTRTTPHAPTADPQTADVTTHDSLVLATNDAVHNDPMVVQAGGAQNTDTNVQSTVFVRADAKQPAVIPTVYLSKGHEALCRVKVGDTMPKISLAQLDGGQKTLTELSGKQATVVVFWKSDRRMAQQQLADLQADVITLFRDAGVAVVGVAVQESAADTKAALQRAGADFPNFLDPEGKAFAQVGSKTLPRTYVLDSQGKIVWFDIEYSLATRRELHQALRAILAQK